MASVNRVVLIGNLGQDPTTRYLPSGDAVTNFTIATTESWKDKKTNEKQEHTEWHRISTFGRRAEVAGEYLVKGSKVYIEGRIRTRKWQDQEGNDRYSTEIVCDQLQFLDSKKREDGGRPEQQEPAGEKRAPPKRPGGGTGSFDDMDDDIPFASASMFDDPMLRKHQRSF